MNDIQNSLYRIARINGIQVYQPPKMIMEGGNIKVDGVPATNIKITSKNRQSVAGDIHNALLSMHKSYHSASGNHLFGKDAKALHTGSAYSGSTNHLMDKKIDHEEFAKHKPNVGDIDVKMNRDHADDFIQNHLKSGQKYGKYTVVGGKKGAGEHHVLMRHDRGEVHQFDLEKSEYHHDEPTDFERFSRSSNWDDVKSGIKGVDHKILLNAIGGKKYKFSPLYGMGEREGENPKWEKDMPKMASKLFGKKVDHTKLSSFHGITELIKKHKSPEEHQEIYDKFKSSISKAPGDHKNAIGHLKNNLSITDKD